MFPTAAQLKLCVDRVIPQEHKPLAASLAIKANPNNAPRIDLLPGVSVHPAKLALFTGKLWSNGRKLGVQFLDGSAFQKAQVAKFAVEWCDYANVSFDFNGGPQAEIRVSFQADPGSWSAVGTDCLLENVFAKGSPTMNFGWLTDQTDDVEYRRVVTHEFGHALGAIHEHQNPKGGLQWNVPAVYAAFSGPPNNWSKEEIDFNILQKYSIDQLNATDFDPESIMLYPFPASLFLNGAGTPTNTDLSAEDKTFIAERYPKAPAAVNA